MTETRKNAQCNKVNLLLGAKTVVQAIFRCESTAGSSSSPNFKDCVHKICENVEDYFDDDEISSDSPLMFATAKSELLTEGRALDYNHVIPMSMYDRDKGRINYYEGRIGGNWVVQKSSNPAFKGLRLDISNAEKLRSAALLGLTLDQLGKGAIAHGTAKGSLDPGVYVFYLWKCKFQPNDGDALHSKSGSCKIIEVEVDIAKGTARKTGNQAKAEVERDNSVERSKFERLEAREAAMDFQVNQDVPDQQDELEY